MRPAHRMERDLRPTLTRPPDFESFWAKTCEKLSAVEPDVHRMPVTSERRPSLEPSRLRFRSLGGVEVAGYSIGWQDDEPRPLVVHSHGYCYTISSHYSPAIGNKIHSHHNPRPHCHGKIPSAIS